MRSRKAFAAGLLEIAFIFSVHSVKFERSRLRFLRMKLSRYLTTDNFVASSSSCTESIVKRIACSFAA